jgi:hypothetical protein
MVDPLFSGGDLRASLANVMRELQHEVDHWPPDELLKAAEADLVEHLTEKYIVEGAVLRRQEAALLPVSEERREYLDERQRQVHTTTTKLMLAVPFDGDAATFNMRASQWTSNPPYGAVQNGELVLTWMGAGASDPGQVKQAFDAMMNKIEQHLGWAHHDIREHNSAVGREVTNLVSSRRAKLLADRQLEAGVGFPVRRRSDADSYSVPVRRKTVTPANPRPTSGTSAPFQPEPALADADFESALRVLTNSRNALERSPTMVAQMKEEQIRDLLLVNLNAQFEGRASGELFNGAGKTDILIRVEDKNIFIAECKIWKSIKTIGEGLDQLLSYLVWRDTKAALLLFVRRKNFSEVVGKAEGQIKLHTNFKRVGPHQGEPGSRSDYVFHANGDPAREIQLAFLPFALSEAAES